MYIYIYIYIYVYICIYIMYINNIVTPIIHVVVILKDNHKKNICLTFWVLTFSRKHFFIFSCICKQKMTFLAPLSCEC